MKKVGPPPPLKVLRSTSLVQHRIMGIIYFWFFHKCKDSLASVTSVKHSGSRSQPLSSRNALRNKDGTAVVLNAG